MRVLLLYGRRGAATPLHDIHGSVKGLPLFAPYSHGTRWHPQKEREWRRDGTDENQVRRG